MALTTEPVVLASQSVVRRRLLESAGVAVRTEISGVDEEPLKTQARAAGMSAAACAQNLAEAKGLAVSGRKPDMWVIGCDQVLDVGGRWLDKPRSVEEARHQLLSLRNQTHVLATAVAVVRNGAVSWSYVDLPELKMWDWPETFLDGYLHEAAPAVIDSVGAYHIEGLGVRLFERVTGCLWSIQGLPLLPLLRFLRGVGVIR